MLIIRTRVIWIVASMGFLACGGLYLMESSRDDAIMGKIRIRYGRMAVALASGDTAAAGALTAPHSRLSPSDFQRLRTFATTLREDSVIHLSGSTARVCPSPVRHWGFIPGGDTVEMIEVGGEWFFTGRVHID
ncbi:MAG: hypothetical protein ABIS50_11295 [Luteolibacter sp.]|uniref:hypothetical protein n=1 Tax=Luteolibacter sp. TaxID=1962973 RepID=UPI003263EA1C